MERLRADGADVRRTPDAGEACVERRLLAGADEAAEEAEGCIRLLASGMPHRLRDELLRDVVHMVRALLAKSFPGLLCLEQSPSATDLAVSLVRTRSDCPADVRVLVVPSRATTGAHSLSALETALEQGRGSDPLGESTVAQLLGRPVGAGEELLRRCGALKRTGTAGGLGTATKSTVPEWCYRDDEGGYIEIEPAVCEQLGAAFCAKEPGLSTSVGRWAYEFDLQRMGQRNSKTGKERQLLRMSKDSVVELLMREERNHEVVLAQVRARGGGEAKDA